MLRLADVDDAIGGGVDAELPAASRKLPVAVAVPGGEVSATRPRASRSRLVVESHARTGITEQSC